MGRPARNRGRTIAGTPQHRKTGRRWEDESGNRIALPVSRISKLSASQTKTTTYQGTYVQSTTYPVTWFPCSVFTRSSFYSATPTCATLSPSIWLFRTRSVACGRRISDPIRERHPEFSPLEMMGDSENGKKKPQRRLSPIGIRG